MSEPKLQPTPTDQPITDKAQKNALLTKINNLTNAAIKVYGEATDRQSFGKEMKGIIREAVEIGVQYQKDVEAAGGTVSRPQIDDKGATLAPSQTITPAPPAPQEPEVTVVSAKAKAKAATAAL